MNQFQEDIVAILKLDDGKTLKNASPAELYQAVSKAALNSVREPWSRKPQGKRACYFSAEFLVGRLVYSNLLNLGLLEQFTELFEENGIDVNLFEEIEDAALGNGGLGRLAACFLDSAATHGIPLNGYGIRYKYGLFKQYFEDGFQRETQDDWQRFGDPWSVRRDDLRVKVAFKNQTVWAVPYDTPVIGWGGKVNTLRLWQAEPLQEFDFHQFNQQKYGLAYQERNEAEAISGVLYPNDDTDKGKRLRLKQQYFFSSASLQDMISEYKEEYGTDFIQFGERFAVQLNDTHPTVSIPEFIRLMELEGLDFDQALSIARKTFAFTNHTIMAEAMEKWSVGLFRAVLPQVYPYVVKINEALKAELAAKGIPAAEREPYRIISQGRIHMARLAVFATHSTNGVAKIHSEILKNTALKEWYRIYPERFNNKTNGITQRRWLALANRELASFLTKKIGDGWITRLDELKKLEAFRDDPAALAEFAQIKVEKKRQLCEYMKSHDNVELNPEFVFDVQVKRLHEYKRQLLNGFSILDLYFGLKNGRIKEFQPTVFLFGAKAAPGYFRAKGIIKYINEIARLVNSDPEVRDRMQVVFVSNYNVSYAERLVTAADISEQISTAGTEASGTGNMKLMLNGAVTLGTYDGANIEIVEQAGEENNYIFGARVEDLEKLEDYDPKALYEKEPRIRAVVDTLVDGTLDDGGTGMFQELYDALLKGASWHKPDHYYLLLDFLDYCNAKLRAINGCGDRTAFTRKCLLNTANAGKFSSDRTIHEYAKEIWGIV